MPRFVVVLPLRPLRDGDGFSLRAWPLHVTIAPTFVTDADLATVIDAIEPVLASQARLQVRAGDDEGFGRSNSLPVTLVEPDPALSGLHHRLVAALLALGVEFDEPDFMGAGYRAHVTITRSDRVHAGDLLQLGQAIVVDMAPDGIGRLRRVVWATQFLEVA